MQAQPGPQPPPLGRPAGLGKSDDDTLWPTEANTESSLVVSTWPSGQLIGAAASLMGLRASNLVSHVRHRYS
jgi:hypothetical protein